MISNKMSEYVSRYFSLRKHHDNDFNELVLIFEKWKMEEMVRCYRSVMSHPPYDALLSYYFNEIYFGIDLSEIKNASLAVNFVDKFFTGTDMLLAALKFNALAGEINQKVVEYIFELNEITEINVDIYADACRQVNVIESLEQQIKSFEDFSNDLNATVSNRSIQAAVKISRLPAKISGCGQLHALVANGLAILRGLENPELVVSKFIAHERLINSRLAANNYPIFLPLEAI